MVGRLGKRVFVSALIGASVAALSACGKSERDPRTEDPLVRIVTVKPNGRAECVFTGVVTARVQSDFGFRVGGKVIERLVDAG